MRRASLLLPVLLAALLPAPGGSAAEAGPVDVGRAHCGKGDKPESGLQGRISRADQLAGVSGFRCGLRLVGQDTIRDRGGNHQLATLGSCAYVTTTSLAGSNPAHPDTGMAVLDVRDPRKPRLVDVVRTTGTLETLEALHAYNGVITATSGNVMDVFDARDCRRPVLRSSLTLPMATHGFRLSDDGRTAWAMGHGRGSTTTGGRYLMAVDISDQARPRVLLEYPQHGGHDLDLSPDGNRAYIAGEGGIVTLDVSDVQRRKASPAIRVVSKITWPAGLSLTSHTAKWVLIKGRPHLLASNEAFKTTCDGRPQARTIDISDERRPKVVAEYGLEVNDAQLCDENRLEADGLSYNVHYVGVDDKYDARVVFWNWFASGVRAFDLRDPKQPREIAFFQPPRKTDVAQKGGLFAEELEFVDLVTPYMWFKPETGHLWISSANNGFQVLEFTAEARRRYRLPAIGKRPARPQAVRYGPVPESASAAAAAAPAPRTLAEQLATVPGGWCTAADVRLPA